LTKFCLQLKKKLAWVELFTVYIHNYSYCRSSIFYVHSYITLVATFFAIVTVPLYFQYVLGCVT